MIKPIDFSERTVCCTAAIEVLRPIINGETFCGKSTVSRMGTIISASLGTSGIVTAFLASFLTMVVQYPPLIPEVYFQILDMHN
jgi:hypothetical protein